MSAAFVRMGVRAIVLCALAYSVLERAQGAPQAKSNSETGSASRVGVDTTGDMFANFAVKSGVPILEIAGVTYKIADFTNDIGVAALDHRDRWIGAEMVLVDKGAKRLKEIKNAGGDLNGNEATTIKQGLHDRGLAMANGHIVRGADVAYAFIKVGIDKVFEKAIDFALRTLGVFRLVEHYMPIPEKINWMLNYGGPLEEFQKGQGWGKLGTRARAGELAASKAIEAVQGEIAARILGRDRIDSANQFAVAALGEIYSRTVTEHPSAPRTVLIDNFRLEAAQAAVLSPAAVEADPVVRAIQADDTLGWQRYSNPVSSQRTTYNSSPAPAPVQTRDSAVPQWRLNLHQSLQNYSTNWDGRRK